MICPHCRTAMHDNSRITRLAYGSQYIGWNTKISFCPECKNYAILFGQDSDVEEETSYFYVYPTSATRGFDISLVPKAISDDYIEACNVISISPKASAALSRRCLQNLLRSFGYSAKDLAKEIDLLINESDTRKAIPSSTREVVDAIRNFGNFSAHPITDVTTLQLINVEPEEADWCLSVLEELFDHFYIRPAKALEKKAALDKKLAQAGKPPSK